VFSGRLDVGDIQALRRYRFEVNRQTCKRCAERNTKAAMIDAGST
jgi:hypothetical protein